MVKMRYVVGSVMLEKARTMNISDLSRHVLGICAAVVLLAGCGSGSQSQLAPEGPLQSGAQSRLGGPFEGMVNLNVSGAAQTDVIVVRPENGSSWMAPGVTGALLYVSNPLKDDVLVFSYPKAKLVGTLSGKADFNTPDQICPDAKGDIWVVNNATWNGPTLVEFKHGGTTPIASLHDLGHQYAVDCAVDPTTGDLAVTNFEDKAGGPGSVAIFKNARGNPQLYYPPGSKASKMYGVYFLGYDPKGNLFVDGERGIYGDAFKLAEIPKGKKTFTYIALKGGKIYFPGNIHWDGKYVAIADQNYMGAYYYPYASGIYQTTGASGKIVGTTPLSGTGDVVGLWIDGKSVVGPVYTGTNQDKVLFWNYPAGGKPTKILTPTDLGSPLGAAISQ
jgi:hypothetical protein